MRGGLDFSIYQCSDLSKEVNFSILRGIRIHLSKCANLLPWSDNFLSEFILLCQKLLTDINFLSGELNPVLKRFNFHNSFTRQVFVSFNIIFQRCWPKEAAKTVCTIHQCISTMINECWIEIKIELFDNACFSYQLQVWT